MTVDNVTDGVTRTHEVIEANGVSSDPAVRIQMQLDALTHDLAEARADFDNYRTQTNVTLNYILASLQDLQNRRPRMIFRWPWESRQID